MKYGVFSDVHGNLEAFEVALARLQKEGAEKYIFCGDLIGYGPDPLACVQLYSGLVQKGLVIGVKGNHDALLTHPELQTYFHPEALQVGSWSISRLDKEGIKNVSFLPDIVPGEDFTVVHGTPRDPLKEYFATSAQYRALYHTWKGQVLFVGHTHVGAYMVGDEQTCLVYTVGDNRTVALESGKRYVINPGSVGRPRDYDARAAFGLWDSTAHTFSFFREVYDLTTTQRKMRSAGLPEFLIYSLSLGM